MKDYAPIPAADRFQHVPVLLVDVVGFTLRYQQDGRKKAVLRRLQDVLTRAARPFLSEDSIWTVWLRHGVGDGYYVVPATLSSRGALAYACKVGEELTRSRTAADPEIHLRVVVAFGDVERVGDQWLSEAFVVAQRFMEDESFKAYTYDFAEPPALVMTELFHHELEDDLAMSDLLPDLEELHFTPVEILDKHGAVHRGRVLGPGWGGLQTTVPDDSGLSVPRQGFLREIFDTLATHPILMLLAQAENEQGELIAAILERARRRVGDRNALYITPPYSAEVEVGRYFTRLGRQCGFEEEINDALAWDDALDERLTGETELFLLIHRLDNGSVVGRRELAGTLRSLLERHRRRLRVVLAGGVKLAELKYEAGEMSLLNLAEALTWPEIELADVVDRQLRDFPGGDLGQGQAAIILDACGGHPRLLRYLLHLWEQKGEMSPTACRRALLDYPFLKDLFQPLSRDPEVRRRLCQWLEQDDLGEFYPWPADGLLRRLYWENLLVVKEDNRLGWRCEVLREAGRQVLRCEP